jgi:hypothetical protein
MGDHINRSFDEHAIVIGACYAVKLNGTQAFVKVTRRLSPNRQGPHGPVKWIGQRVGVVDGPDEGKEVEITLDQIIKLASGMEMFVQAVRQGWESDNDIHDYLRDCGIEMNISTISSYKSQYRNGTLLQVRTRTKSDSGQARPQISLPSPEVRNGRVTISAGERNGAAKVDTSQTNKPEQELSCLTLAKGLVAAAGSWEKAHNALDALKALTTGLPQA